MKRSEDKIPSSLDQKLDKEVPSGNGVAPAVSLHNGPIDEMDLDEPQVNGTHTNGVQSGKRKAVEDKNTKAEEESEDDSDDQPVPLFQKRQRVSTGNARKRKTIVSSESESDDIPIQQKRSTTKRLSTGTAKAKQAAEAEELKHEKEEVEKHAEKEAKALREADKAKAAPKSAKRRKSVKKQESSDESDEAPVAKRKRTSKGKEPVAPTKKKTPAKKQAKNEESSEDVKPASRKTAKATSAKGKKAITNGKTSAKGKAVKAAAPDGDDDPEDPEGEGEEEEEYRWWEDTAKGDGSEKWKTLEHAGVVFPPPYEPLPEDVKMLYEGVPVTLKPEAEEVAGFFGAMLNSTVNVSNKTFIKNFFNDFKEVLSKTGGAVGPDGKKIKIKEFEKCDFTPIFNYYEEKRAEKKALPAAEKKRLKAEKDAAEAPYQYCLWDGRKEKVGNFRVEPPGLFRGRGEHPKTGHLKKRVQPEQITINIGETATVPAPPAGHRWKEVRHDHTGTWLAMWQENINGAYKYVMLSANSAIKGQSDYNKFEKARELKKHIDRIRKDYRRNLKSELMVERQTATAVYLIDQLALRAGNEKGEDEADTVGCCSLKFEHVTLKPPNIVIFDFLGKDSIRFYQEIEIDEQVFKNLKIFKKEPKVEGDEIFDRLKTTQLNKHLSDYMPGLTAKVFRTYNASWTMAEELRKMKSTGTIADKLKDYTEANRRVAILCNHKRTIPASHEGAMEKLGNQIKGLKYQKWRIKQMMINLDSKIKKKKGADFFKLDEDLDEEWILQHQEALVKEQREKIEKKFQKENEKLVEGGEKEMKASELQERMKVADEMEEQFKKENRTKKVEAEGKSPTIDKLKANLEKIEQRIETMNAQAESRESTKEVALGTSKINYIDPRLTVVFSKKFDVPIERLFSKTLREKFDWAIKSVDENWEF
ncbi:MAG: DNA topoisomerase 1 [Watsoniomyces obsoletus]|nr:MAG: DNA topoisomerase 1 [Watsoniomyces obsoletus]